MKKSQSVRLAASGRQRAVKQNRKMGPENNHQCA